ncbi:MAG: prephenate dehydrogenase/arogenate dehydrogenase family protein [Candidatus Margulisiibacteriota bacterium]
MRIAIIGLGLIGGSLGLALKKAGRSDLQIVGIPHREETLKQAIDIKAIDVGTLSHVEGVKDADIVFICTPIHLILPIIEEIAPNLKKGAIVTDVGSSKYEIVSQAEKKMPKGTFFVGGHPMAGKETVKISAAEADLFNCKTWILTKTSKTGQKAVEKIKELIIQTGANTMELDPKTHDLVVAGISHMPLAVAAALVNTINSEEQKDAMAKAASSGFRDTTRVASGDPILGVDMFTTNKKAVLKMLSAFKRSLSNIENLIKEGNGEKLHDELEKAKKFRDSIFKQ